MWNHCSEDSPTDSREVLIAYRYRGQIEYEIGSYDGKWHPESDWDAATDWDEFEVLAWMEIPEYQDLVE